MSRDRARAARAAASRRSTLAPLADPGAAAPPPSAAPAGRCSSPSRPATGGSTPPGSDFDGLLGDAAGAAAQHRPAQGQGGRARDRDPRPFRRARLGRLRSGLPRRAGSPRKAPSLSCARSPSRKARPARCGSASPARTAGRSRPSSGWSRMARRRSTSSLMPRMPRRCRPARCSAWRCSARALDEDRVRRDRLRHRRRRLQARLDGRAATALAARRVQPAHAARPGRRGAGRPCRRLSARVRSR